MSDSEKTGNVKRSFIGMFFEECSVYSRIYKNKAETAYVGFCPKCGRKVSIKIGANGIGERFFRSDISR